MKEEVLVSHRNDLSQTDPPARAGVDDVDDVDDAALQKRTIADFYSRVAADYDSVGPAVFARFGEHSVALAGIGAGAQVLDVAAGRGANLFPAAAAVGASGRVVGIDLAPEMVALTARAIAEQGLTNATMLYMDAEALDIADGSFDVVLCSFAYFLFPHLDRALAECARVLRAGGTLLLTTHGLTDEHWRWYDELLVATYARHGLPWPYTVGGGRRRLDELEALLAGAGFTDLRQVPVEVEAVYATSEQWWAAKWTHGARRALECLPPDLLQEFVSVVNVHLAGLQQTDGFHDSWRIVCLLGTKPAT
jgi:ubiquinone/menaquinone biosynthesis C-methylase UbiE